MRPGPKNYFEGIQWQHRRRKKDKHPALQSASFQTGWIILPTIRKVALTGEFPYLWRMLRAVHLLVLQSANCPSRLPVSWCLIHSSSWAMRTPPCLPDWISSVRHLSTYRWPVKHPVGMPRPRRQTGAWSCQNSQQWEEYFYFCVPEWWYRLASRLLPATAALLLLTR